MKYNYQLRDPSPLETAVYIIVRLLEVVEMVLWKDPLGKMLERHLN